MTTVNEIWGQEQEKRCREKARMKDAGLKIEQFR